MSCCFDPLLRVVKITSAAVVNVFSCVHVLTTHLKLLASSVELSSTGLLQMGNLSPHPAFSPRDLEEIITRSQKARALSHFLFVFIHSFTWLGLRENSHS